MESGQDKLLHVSESARATSAFASAEGIMLRDMEIIFEVRDAEEGGFFARALGHAIFTEAETWEDLRRNVQEAAILHFEDTPVQPRMIQLHYVKDELIPVEAA